MSEHQHDIHQYYFERFLRHQMSADEKATFEEKLSVDPDLKASFDAYKANRKVFLDALAKEHEESRNPWKKHSYIYLAVSLIGIVLAINFYIDNQELKAEQQRTKSLIAKLIERIPFVGKKETKNDQPATTQQTGKPAQSNSDNLPVLTGKENVYEEDSLFDDEIKNPDEMSMATDELLHDTFLVAIDKNYFEIRYRLYRTEIDTTLSDSSISGLIMRNASKYPEKSARQQTVFVEFWQSPIHYKGYRFNGKKLLVYGLKYPFPIVLLKEDEHLLLHWKDHETVLENDNEFHKF